MKNFRGWSDHFIELQSNLFLRTPLYYGQFVWSLKYQKSYILYLYNTETSIKRTIGSVPLVSVLKRFDYTFQMASDLIHAIGKSRFGFQISQWNENSFSQAPRKFTQTQRRILLKKIRLRPGLQSTDYGTKFFWISCLNPITRLKSPWVFSSIGQLTATFFRRAGYSVLFYNGHLNLSQCHCKECRLCQVTPENDKAEVFDRKNSRLTS